MPATIHELTEATSFTPGTSSELVMAVTTDSWTTERARRINTANFVASLLNQAIVINESGAAVDFRVEASGAANALFIEGDNGRVGIGTATPAVLLHVNGASEFEGVINTNGNWISGDGDSEGLAVDASGNVGIGQSTPTAKLEVEVGATDAVSGILVDQNDTDQIALQIDSEATTADVIDIIAPATTTGNVIDINADALTTGSILELSSDSSQTNTRYLINLINDNTAATGTVPLRIQQDSTGDIVQIFDGASQVVTIDDEGNITTTGVISTSGVARISTTAGANFDAKLTAAISGLSNSGIVVIDGTYTYDGSSPVTVPAGITLQFENGQIDMDSATGNLIINGPIVAPETSTPIFVMPSPTNMTTGCKLKIRHATGTGPYSKDLTTQCNPYVREIPALWFDDDDADDIGLRIQKAIAAGGEGVCVALPPGSRDLATSVVLDKDSWPEWVTIRGHNMLSSSICITDAAAIIGFNLYNAEECLIEKLRIYEASGSTQSICIYVTGSTNMINKCWIGNAGYGIVTNRSAGCSIVDTVIENCLTGLWIHPGGTIAITGMVAGSNVTDMRVSNVEIYSCTTVNLDLQQEGVASGRSICFTGCVFKTAGEAGRNIIIDTNSYPRLLQASFVNCSQYGCENLDSPYCGSTINDAQIIWIGGHVLNEPDTAVGGQTTCGFYITGTSLVKFIGVYRGNWQLTDTQNTLFVRVSPAHVVDIEGIEDNVFLPVTASALGNTTQRINLDGKYPGKIVWDSTNEQPVWSTGYDAADPWVYADGTTATTPGSATPSHTPSHTVSHTPSHTASHTVSHTASST